jgi:hypothetical protein
MLGGDAHRIFSINLPYLHYAAGTLKAVDDRQRAAINQLIGAGSRTYYQRKWGGPVNEERFASPFLQDGTSGYNQGQATTPRMQARTAQGLPPIGCPLHDHEPDGKCQECLNDLIADERMRRRAADVTPGKA